MVRWVPSSVQVHSPVMPKVAAATFIAPRGRAVSRNRTDKHTDKIRFINIAPLLRKIVVSLYTPATGLSNGKGREGKPLPYGVYPSRYGTKLTLDGKPISIQSYGDFWVFALLMGFLLL